MKINACNNIQFGSGLNKITVYKEKLAQPNNIRKLFQNDYSIETNFLENKSAAFANNLCLKIVNDLFKQLGISLTLPPAIYLYNSNQLEKKVAENFCIPDTENVLKDDYPFLGRSIFFKNFENLEDINSKTERLFANKKSSSSHFLAHFIHEWVHSIQLDYIYKKYGYGGECDVMKSIYDSTSNNYSVKGVELLKTLENKTLSKHENEIVYDVLGEYATLPRNQYLEVFSEGLTKFICDSLDVCKLKQNPVEQFKKTNKEFRNIFYKICSLK